MFFSFLNMIFHRILFFVRDDLKKKKDCVTCNFMQSFKNIVGFVIDQSNKQ